MAPVILYAGSTEYWHILTYTGTICLQTYRLSLHIYGTKRTIIILPVEARGDWEEVNRHKKLYIANKGLCVIESMRVAVLFGIERDHFVTDTYNH